MRRLILPKKPACAFRGGITRPQEGHRHGCRSAARPRGTAPCAPTTYPCPRCGKAGRRKQVHPSQVRDTAYRGIVLLDIELGAYRARCACCKTFRSQPPGVEAAGRVHQLRPRGRHRPAAGRRHERGTPAPGLAARFPARPVRRLPLKVGGSASRLKSWDGNPRSQMWPCAWQRFGSCILPADG